MSEGPILNQLNLVVSDMETTVAFYRRLGVSVEDTEAEWAADHRSVTMPGGIELEFDSLPSVDAWNKGWPSGRHAPVLGFKVGSSEAVDELYADLIASGVVGQQPPIDAFWGSRYAVVEDPDGNAVGIMGPREAAKGSA